MRDIKTVLCPLDFSATSRHALDHAAAVAKWYHARLVGLHAYWTTSTSVPDLVIAHGGVPSDAETVRRIRSDVDAALAPARAAGVETDVRAIMGPAADAILDYARYLPADLLVMGTHGSSGFERLLLGSVTEKVLRKATCPVLTVPPRAQSTSALPFKHLLCPVDFSDGSLEALTLAFSIAQQCDGMVTVLHVLESTDEAEPLTDRPMNVPEYARYREEDAGARLGRLLPDGVTYWCAAVARIAQGKPYREILNVAAEIGADLIVIGVHGRNPVDTMLFGSTTNQVVRQASCPVLTLRH